MAGFSRLPPSGFVFVLADRRTEVRNVDDRVAHGTGVAVFVDVFPELVVFVRWHGLAACAAHVVGTATVNQHAFTC